MTNTDITTTDITTTDTTTTPVHPTPAPGEVRDLMARAVSTTAEVIGTVRPDQLDLHTPCDGLDVRELVVHLNEVLDRLAALGRGESPFPIARREAPTDDALLDTFRIAAHELQAAWSDPRLLDTPMVLPWAQGPGREIMSGYIAELSTHTWDLARAVDADVAWDDAVIADGLATIRQWLPAEGRAELFAAVGAAMGPDAGPPPYALAVPVAADAPLIDQLVAHQGRSPLWTT